MGALAAAIVSAICVLGFIPPVVLIVGAAAPATLGAGIEGAAPAPLRAAASSTLLRPP